MAIDGSYLRDGVEVLHRVFVLLAVSPKGALAGVVQVGVHLLVRRLADDAGPPLLRRVALPRHLGDDSGRVRERLREQLLVLAVHAGEALVHPAVEEAHEQAAHLG